MAELPLKRDGSTATSAESRTLSPTYQSTEYSTLEVDTNHFAEHKEPLPQTVLTSPNGIRPNRMSGIAPEVISSGELYVKELETEEPAPKRRRCSALTIAIILAVIVIIVVAATVGGVLGSRASQKKHTAASEGTAGQSSSGGGSSGSVSQTKIAAVSWTNVTGPIHFER